MTTAVHARVAVLTLEVKCPLQIETASQWEGAYWVECACDVEVTIEYGPDAPGDWRIATMPEGCPLQPHHEPWHELERVELVKRITDAWENHDWAPWCSRCGSNSLAGCDCPTYADNE